MKREIKFRVWDIKGKIWMVYEDFFGDSLTSNSRVADRRAWQLKIRSD